MLLLQRRRQRRAAADRLAHALHHATRLGRVGKLEQDAQRPVQRLARTQQGGQLLGELQHLFGAELLALEQGAHALAAGLVGAARFNGQVALLLQARDHLVGAAGLHLAIERFARRRQRLVAEHRHRPSLPG